MEGVELFTNITICYYVLHFFGKLILIRTF